MGPLDKIISYSQSRVADRLRQAFELDGMGDSPIEAYLYTALFAAVRYTDTEFRGIGLGRQEADNELARDKSFLYVTPQRKHGKYRIDFLVEAFDGRAWIPLAVECDGHDYHERTKDQARRDRLRDRVMTLDGLTVFRFTGSEIYRDPMACADQIIAWAHQQAWRHL